MEVDLAARAGDADGAEALDTVDRVLDHTGEAPDAEAPDVELPEVEVPEVEVPGVALPEVELPGAEAASGSAPSPSPVGAGPTGPDVEAGGAGEAPEGAEAAGGPGAADALETAQDRTAPDGPEVPDGENGDAVGDAPAAVGGAGEPADHDPDGDLPTAEIAAEPDWPPHWVAVDELQLRFVEVAMVLPSTNPVVVLEEVDPPHRRLCIPVGTAEGVAIAYAARRLPTPKPLTHELFTDVFEAFAFTLDVVRITEVSGSAFSAELVVSGPTGTRTIACRPSDGIALALRQRLVAPITAVGAVLDTVGLGGGNEADG